MFLYSCKALYRVVSPLLIVVYADYTDFLATKKHKETKNIDTNFLDADYADCTDF